MGANRTILVTGCSSGIGAYCATRLKADGWRVLATARKPEDLKRLEADGFETCYLDYAEPSSIETCFAWAMEQTGGKLDALFNNGAYAQGGAVEDLPVEALRAQFEANVFGWHDLTRRVVPVMLAQRQGRIVHNSSVLGFVPFPYRGAYTASKYAIEGLMLTLLMELEGSGVHVSLIEPGSIPSRIAQNGIPHFHKHIEIGASRHRKAYETRLKEMEQGGQSSDMRDMHDLYRCLLHALQSPRPRVHYRITRAARAAAVMKRVLPSRVLYGLIGKTA